MKEEKEPQEEPVEPANESTPKSSKQKSSQYMLSDKEVEANEKGAAYPNDGPFGIGMIKGK
jgi:hypothetical protein